MPFMLRSCGHALRFMTPDGICRRCCKCEDGGWKGKTENGVGEGLSQANPGLRVKNEQDVGRVPGPGQLSKENEEELVSGANKVAVTQSESSGAFAEQVEKVTAVVIHSDQLEIDDAVSCVGKSLSTFTAAERAQFIYQVIIMYCEARREDQPKLAYLLKELAKKKVLAAVHYIHSAKKLITDTVELVVDWPNLYGCCVMLMVSSLEQLQQPKQLIALEQLFTTASTGHAHKYLAAYQAYLGKHPQLDCTTSLPPAAQNGGAFVIPDGDSSAVPEIPPGEPVRFFRQPSAVPDRFIRPLAFRQLSEPIPSRSHRPTYSREYLLEVRDKIFGEGEGGSSVPLPVGLLERVKIIKNDTWVGDRDMQHGKRPRYVSESSLTFQNDMEPAKRILETTSPHLPLQIQADYSNSSNWQEKAPVFQPPAFQQNYIKHGDQPVESGGFFREPPRRQEEDIQRAVMELQTARKPLPRERESEKPFSPSSDKAMPSPTRILTLHSSPSKPPTMETALSALSPPTTVVTQPIWATGDGQQQLPLLPTPFLPGKSTPAAKTKKFLTALNVEKKLMGEEAEVTQLSPTLGHSGSTWARGSGSLKPSNGPWRGKAGAPPLGQDAQRFDHNSGQRQFPSRPSHRAVSTLGSSSVT